MSYDTTVIGEITITPPINHKQLRDAFVERACDDWNFQQPSSNHWIRLNVLSASCETDEGILTNRYAEDIVPNTYQVGRGHTGVAADLGDLIKVYCLERANLTGAFQVVGEDGRHWRVFARKNEKGVNEVVQVEATLTWPEGTPIVDVG